MGVAFVNLNECTGDPTSCLWDNGSTDTQTELAVGPHTVTFFNGITPLYTENFEIEQLQWEVDQFVYVSAGTIAVDAWLAVPYCGTQIFNFLACPPNADATVAYLLQDGIAIDSVSPISCTAATVMWNNLPFGYTYQVIVEDNSICGSLGAGPAVNTYTCDGSSLILATQPASGGDNGSIHVQEVLLDAGSSMPPPMPVIGTFLLFTWPVPMLLEEEPMATTVLWEDLAPGEYLVRFNADNLCTPIDSVITIDNSTWVSGTGNGDTQLYVWPQPTMDVLYWNSEEPGTITVFDVQGRMVFTAPDQGRLDVADLPQGLYYLELLGAIGRHARFYKL